MEERGRAASADQAGKDRPCRTMIEARPMTRAPKMDPRAAARPPVPPAVPADYSDELTEAQIEALRRFAPQDERQMGPLVHEFTW